MLARCWWIQYLSCFVFCRRGITKFYCGKSKSFTSLADVLPSSSSKDPAKPENCYSRKRKKLLSFNLWRKPSQNSHRSSGDIAVSKRPANSSRSTKGLGPSTSSSSGSNGSREEHHSQHQKLPSLHPQGKAIAQICSSAPTNRFSFPTRSFSLADLEGCGGLGPISWVRLSGFPFVDKMLFTLLTCLSGLHAT